MLCGVPNHGVFDWEDNPGSEFNGRGPFLRELNAGESEVTPGTAFLTLRSDGMDKYAQADGRFVGKPGVATNVTNEGPTLKGATNLVLGTIDHREVAFHPRAFREIYKFIAGREPARIEIVPEAEVRLSGFVTATPGGVQTNRPVGGATVELYHVSPDRGERIGGPIHSSQTGADGRWGPAKVDPSWYLEMVLTSQGAPITHFYRSPFPRSSDVVQLRAAKAPGPADAGAGSVIIMSFRRAITSGNVLSFPGRGTHAAGPGADALLPVLIVLHQETSTPGRVGNVLRALGHTLDIRRPRFGDALPETLDEHGRAAHCPCRRR